MTFDDIADFTDQEIQMIMDETDSDDLPVALKAAERLPGRILGMLSEAKAKDLKERMEFAGPVRLSDVERLQHGIVYRVLQLEHEGKLKIPRENDPFV